MVHHIDSVGTQSRKLAGPSDWPHPGLHSQSPLERNSMFTAACHDVIRFPTIPRDIYMSSIVDFA